MAQITGKRARWLLRDLCVIFGFCILPDEAEYLCQHPPDDAQAMVDAVVRIDGLEPESVKEKTYTQMIELASKVYQAFTEESQKPCAGGPPSSPAPPWLGRDAALEPS